MHLPAIHSAAAALILAFGLPVAPMSARADEQRVVRPLTEAFILSKTARLPGFAALQMVQFLV